ncbi:MAG: hypothetical protein KIT22_02870 [Verrucomicrobiae bacterium]|nr:hypothetical protein [Verrucomicrobiae bacterium]
MKKPFLIRITPHLSFLVIGIPALAQPAMTNGVIATLDFDGDESQDIEYQVSATKVRDQPEQWNCGFGLVPLRASRLLRRSAEQLEFAQGELIDNSRPLFREVIDPTLVVYSLPLLGYRATLEEDWEYHTIKPALEAKSDLLIGVKAVVDTGTHYGWIHLRRPVVDKHTPFELVDYVAHPLPDEPIAAGEPPSLPPIHAEVAQDNFTFSWDSRWGNLVLETTADLEPPIVWQEVVVSAGGPVTVLQDDEPQRFFRLRLP